MKVVEIVRGMVDGGPDLVRLRGKRAKINTGEVQLEVQLEA